MSLNVCLAMAWHPRGEKDRLLRYYPQLQELYSQIVIGMPPESDPDVVKQVRALPDVHLLHGGDWRSGRHLVLRKAVEIGAEHIQYVDGDRVIRWIELHPGELRAAAEQVMTTDCLVLGRTPYANETHPQALKATERICNTVFSNLIGRELDFTAGSRGLSRAAAQFVLENSPPDRPMGTDSEWVMLAHRGGFHVEGMLVDGLDYETADRFLPQAADAETQRRVADAYDADPAHWVFRAKIAQEIVDAGLDALARPLRVTS